MEKYVMSYELSNNQLKDYNLNNIISKMLPDDKSVSDIIDLDIKIKSKLIRIMEGEMEGRYEDGIKISIYLNLK